MKLCIKHGIRTLKVGNVELHAELPMPAEPVVANNSTNLGQTIPYTDSDYLMWSAGPHSPEG